MLSAVSSEDMMFHERLFIPGVGIVISFRSYHIRRSIAIHRGPDERRGNLQLGPSRQFILRTFEVDECGSMWNQNE